MALKWTISNDILLIPSHKIVRFQIAGELCDFFMIRNSLTEFLCIIIGYHLVYKTLALQHMNYSLTWYKSGRKIPVTQVKLSRIHQHENLLWFMPAILEDSGSYECECNLIDNERFLSRNDDLRIISANVNDSGNYSCKMTYNYMGKEYNISRNIYVTVIGKSRSNVIVDCNISSFKDNSIAISWKVNNTLVKFLFMGRVQEGNQKDSLPDGYLFSTVTLNITEVKQEDYGHPFVCHAGEVAAYIALRRPGQAFRYLIGGLLAPVFVIVVAMLIYKYFKVDIVLWYRKSFSDGKIYDAYVLYPKINKVDCIYTSDNFVLTLLPEVLERQCGYNLFILGRDDLPGKAVVNVVDETIKQSRRLIIVLVPESSSLLEDIFEQQLAVYNALVQDGIKVILIELDKIKDYTNMPESIKYIKQKHGAIKWKGDFTEKSYSANTKFWKNVRYRMPPRCPTSSELHLLPTALNTFQTTER
uniref:Uncharacterized protein n=1 Tax=Chelydra serpentina TaxID=8475 RepID=A0A8C3T5S9_CHESE